MGRAPRQLRSRRRVSSSKLSRANQDVREESRTLTHRGVLEDYIPTATRTVKGSRAKLMS